MTAKEPSTPREKERAAIERSACPKGTGLARATGLLTSSPREMAALNYYLMWRLIPRSRSGQRTMASRADRRGLRVLACAK